MLCRHIMTGERVLIAQIADRAARELAQQRGEVEHTLWIAHANSCPLDLLRLLYSSEGNFAFDILGLRKNLNPMTGEVERDFRPVNALRSSPIWNGCPLPNKCGVAGRCLAAVD